MPFKGRQKSAFNLDAPDKMYADIRPRKSGPLYSQQRDILEAYANQAIDLSDVAFHLPTGAGKTLVGLLVAEWRRRKFGERVVYLCPTKWLVNQVVFESNDKYGIRALGFTGKVALYDPVAKAEWTTGDAIAVATYSALFNNRPFFEKPHFVLLDDAHSAENYVASFWTVEINRHDEDHAVLWSAFVSVLRPAISPLDYPKLVEPPKESWDQGWSDLVPMPKILALQSDIVAILDEHVGELNLRFPWRRIRERLHACNIFISDRQIAIRPIMPPTRSFAPFNDAKQRLYMSATLGEGGELERITGRTSISRLKSPTGYDRQAIGRRLFIFPQRSLADDDGVRALVHDFMRTAGRSLVIVPNDTAAKAVHEEIVSTIGYDAFTAKRLEESKGKDEFVKSSKAVAVVANRYDGIDFPGEECRLLVMDGLPRAVNLQERVLINKMSAVALLSDRIRTRLIQAVGRCTRSDEDYSAVVVLGDELATYFGEAENRALLHPELQAEVEFGLYESTGISAEAFQDNLGIFLNQEKNPEPWREANEDILGRRDGKVQAPLKGADALSASVHHELRYLYAIWDEKFTEALEECRKVLALINKPGLRGWEGFWTYLAGTAAFLAAQNGDAALQSTAIEYYQRAAKLIPSCRWLSRGGLLGLPEFSPVSGDADPALMAMILRLESQLDGLGMQNDHRFAKVEKSITEGLYSGEGKVFERAHLRLGELLGFDAGQSHAKAAPDPYWLIDETLCIVFEDNAGAKGTSVLDVDKARQAATHEDWIRENIAGAMDARIIAVLITPSQQADRFALPFLRRVALWSLGDFQAWAIRALGCVRSLRATYTGPGNLVWQSSAAMLYRRYKIDPASLLEQFEASNAKQVFSTSLLSRSNDGSDKVGMGELQAAEDQVGE